MRLTVTVLTLLLAAVSAQQFEEDNYALDSASLPAEHRSGADFGPNLIPAASDNWPLAAPDMPSITNLQVQCDKTYMRVSVEFDRPFHGMIFSKGYFSDASCVHLRPGSNTLHAQFDIYLNSCGMSSSSSDGNYGQPTPSGTFIENTVIIQYDPLVQEVWDAARKLRCTWYDYYEKSVTFRPFQVDMLNAVTANFLGDNLQCWMQIQVGKGPWASEVSGIVKIGQTMTMVLAIKDDENKFDMMVRNCVAHDGKRAPIQLVDDLGCVTRPKIMGRFQKIKDFGASASVVSYAYFQAFKFPDSMNVHFQCVIQVCRYKCPEPQCGGGGIAGPSYSAGGIGGPGFSGAGGAGFAGAGFGGGHFGGDPSFAEYASGSAPQPAALPDPRTPNKESETPVPEPNRALADELPHPVPVNIELQPNTLSIPKPNRVYPGVNRQGVDSTFAGRPRSVNFDDDEDTTTEEVVEEPSIVRRRRSAIVRIYKRAAQEMTDVSTERVIQVVAPGDVAFNLNTANETVVVSELQTDPSNICMSTAGFAAGLIMLLLVLTVACLVACFLYTRVRAFNYKNSPSVPAFMPGFESPEYVKNPAAK
ncbi:Zona pellucida domain [Trinorchestia longiramus]|nr:Zona pellucida domain [Trinorchestia longiramus]